MSSSRSSAGGNGALSVNLAEEMDAMLLDEKHPHHAAAGLGASHDLIVARARLLRAVGSLFDAARVLPCGDSLETFVPHIAAIDQVTGQLVAFAKSKLPPVRIVEIGAPIIRKPTDAEIRAYQREVLINITIVH